MDSIRYANRFESIRFVKKSAVRFTICHAVFLAYLFIVSVKKYTTMHAVESYTVYNIDKKQLRNALCIL